MCCIAEDSQQSSKVNNRKGIHCTANNTVVLILSNPCNQSCTCMFAFGVSMHKYYGTTPYTQYSVIFTCNCDSSQYPKIDVCQVHFSVSLLHSERPVIKKFEG